MNISCFRLRLTLQYSLRPGKGSKGCGRCSPRGGSFPAESPAASTPWGTGLSGSPVGAVRDRSLFERQNNPTPTERHKNIRRTSMKKRTERVTWEVVSAASIPALIAVNNTSARQPADEHQPQPTAQRWQRNNSKRTVCQPGRSRGARQAEPRNSSCNSNFSPYCTIEHFINSTCQHAPTTTD